MNAVVVSIFKKMSLYPIPNYDNEPIADDKHERFMTVLKHHSENQTHPIPEWRLLEIKEVNDCQCICTQPILNQYFISNDITKTTLIIGSDCMKRFLDPTLRCKECGGGITTGIVERIEAKNFICKQCTKEKKDLRREVVKRLKNYIFRRKGLHYQEQFKDIILDRDFVTQIVNLPENQWTPTVRAFQEYAYAVYDFEEQQVEI